MEEAMGIGNEKKMIHLAFWVPSLSQSKINWIRNATSFYSVQKTGQSGFQLSFEHGIYLCRIRLTLRGFHNLTNE